MQEPSSARQYPRRYGQHRSAPILLIGPDLHGQDFPILALDGHFQRAAANLTVNNELLRRLGGVHFQRENLSTKWTLNVFRFLHLPEQEIVGIVVWLYSSLMERMSI
jgi:hypothetical protein